MEKEEIKKVKETFEEASKKYYECVEIKRKVNEVSLETIKAVLSKAEGNSVEIDEDNMMCVPYDGGNHPEYAANPFSIIYRVKSFGDDDIRLDIEDTDDYPLENISTLELYYLCLYISDNKEELKDIARNNFRQQFK